jgi:hypothetical protein
MEHQMNKTVLAVSIVLAQFLAVNAFAAGGGEVDPAAGKAAPSQKSTKEEKAAAKAERKKEGASEAKQMKTGDVDTSTKTTTKKATKAEKDAARAARKASSAEMAKKHSNPAGEVMK